uniref:Large ribosomal subunit protein mL44 n=1 Tax=Petromyzon marinus TaxID=7757 RepID=A0AAJ7UGN5_PETMA|nr:39S ribosomal protein L44, mitochondrial isoform X6 [Petromyzon marinus]
MAALSASLRSLTAVTSRPLLPLLRPPPLLLHHHHHHILHRPQQQQQQQQQQHQQQQQQRGHKRWLRAHLALQARMERKAGKPPPPLRRERDNFDLSAELAALACRLGEEHLSPGQLAAAVRSPCCDRGRGRGGENHGELAGDGARLTAEVLDSELARDFPRMPDGGRDALRTFLMSDETLSGVARALGLAHLVLAARDPPPDSALARSLLAIVSLVRASGGEERTIAFLQSFVLPQLLCGGRDLFSLWPVGDPMSLLREETERRSRAPPEPRLIRSAGAASALPCYLVAIYSDGRVLSEAPGETPLVAEEEAARSALRRLYGFPATRLPAQSVASGTHSQPQSVASGTHSQPQSVASGTHSTSETHSLTATVRSVWDSQPQSVASGTHSTSGTHSQPQSVASGTHSQPQSVASGTHSQPQSVASGTHSTSGTHSQPQSVASGTHSQPQSVASGTHSQPQSVASGTHSTSGTHSQPQSVASGTHSQPQSVASGTHSTSGTHSQPQSVASGTHSTSGTHSHSP